MIFDANGTAVTSDTAFCARCGAHIKHVFEYGGQVYGSTCIEAASGIRPDAWVWRNGRYDEQATREKVERQERESLERVAAFEASEAKRVATLEHNRTRYAELANVLRNASRYDGDFCGQMAWQIENCATSTELYGILTDRQYQVVVEIWAKQTGGRKGSKAYEAAEIEFCEKFDHEVLEVA